MTEENNFSFREMQHNLLAEAEGLKKSINENLVRIAEIDKYLDSIYGSEEENFKVFSPRNVEHIYRDDIVIHKEEKNKLEMNNRSLYSRLNKVNTYLATIDNFISKSPVTRNFEVLDIQEKERHRIARDLHDTSLQNLSHLLHKIELASMYIEKDVLQAKLELATVSKGLKAVIEEIRNTIFDLRPMTFDDLGLKESFEILFSKLKENNTLYDIDAKVQPIVCQNDLVLMTIFRVVQEACENAIKHSQGNKITIVIEQKKQNCYVLIKDNGNGFSWAEEVENSSKHFGISVMTERIHLLGGKISFYSKKGEGTEIKMMIPLE